MIAGLDSALGSSDGPLYFGLSHVLNALQNHGPQSVTEVFSRSEPMTVVTLL